MNEAQSTAALDKGKPDQAMLKDVLKPSNLIIALFTSVLFILLGWYLFILEPALRESNPLDLKITKKTSSSTPLSKELKFETEAETQSTDNNFERSNPALGNEEKSEVVPRDSTTRRTKSTRSNTSRKSAKSIIERSEKVPTAQFQDAPNLQNMYVEDKKEANITTENIRVEEDRKEYEDKDEETAQKIKSFALKWKESFLTPTTQPICTQVQIAMNQCPN